MVSKMPTRAEAFELLKKYNQGILGAQLNSMNNF